MTEQPPQEKDPIYGSAADIDATLPPGGMSPEETAVLREKLRNPEPLEESLADIIARAERKSSYFKSAISEVVKERLGEDAGKVDVEVTDFHVSDKNDPSQYILQVIITRNGEKEEREIIVKPE
jgi:hypothetical protein